MIPAEKIEQIKAKSDIVEVISDFVALKKKGKEFVGLSPFNNERTPSFSVNPAKGIYKCFSSGKGGDVIDFIMNHLSLKYYDAIGYLAKRYNIEIESDTVYTIPERKVYQQLPASFIPVEHVTPTLGHPDDNNLFKYLCTKFPADIVAGRFQEYFIGTHRNWCIFWQVDARGGVRSGKYINYHPNGHRDKDSKTSWHHNSTKEYKPLYPDFNLQQCLFGEHLVARYPRRPIAIVESEKTALIASLIIDKYTWLSCCMKGGLNASKLASVANRSITLFPDLGAFDEWRVKATEFNLNISDHIERIATDDDRGRGLDLADFLLR
ncbi:DUF6371 domain-containing protein [Mucilaginibacter sp. SP1R1]|uniref:DUF6371 domain-containing protein n=1 Tax=Mucilaginibacter sp. SP1R1 TaxID=2723091 RepID=UPI00160C98F4|nr:DUF6371 domain-containing protein [Mucilaginibacter sp. SP1R1]MBB6149452.1 hypothetical protein [Mucilaginibacter sp. SP1R1]